MAVNKLSARTVATAKEPGLYGDGNGLYLQVSKTSTKSWILRYQLAGRRRDMGLGSLDSVSLAEVRDLVAGIKKDIAAGIDPIDAREKGSEAVGAGERFRECAERYITLHEPLWRNKTHRTQWRNTLATYVYPVIGDLSVKVITVEHVLQIIKPIWFEKTETANRVRARIETVMGWSHAHGIWSGENPARWHGHLEHLLPSPGKLRGNEHHPALPYKEMPDFWVRLTASEGIGSRALGFCVLTATRTSEALGARWDEVSLDDRLWVIPKERMKGGREHRVPLSEQSLVILKSMASIRQSDFVFSGMRPGKPLSNMTFLMILRRMKMGHVTGHGFRSTFRDWAAEQTSGYENEMLEMALAHAVADKVEAAYRRGDMLDKRRSLMAEWGRFCESGLR